MAVCAQNSVPATQNPPETGSLPGGLPSARYKRIPLETKTRLSNSVVWRLQREHYERRGANSWNDGTLPYYITSNPFIADAYARVVHGFRLDCNETILVVELGAGHGRFAYLFLRGFLETCRSMGLPEACIKYVMTDASESTVRSWLNDRRLAPFVERNILDFAVFEAGKTKEVNLLVSRARLGVSNLRLPIAVIANYVFDSVPQDVFVVERGRLFEALVTTTAPDGASTPKMPALTDLQVAYCHQLASAEYYADATWNQILDEYRHRLPSATVTLPTGALHAISALQAASDGRFLLLSADKGFDREVEMESSQGPPPIEVHGGDCFSLMVNYHAIGRYFENQGGRMLRTAFQSQSLAVCAFLSGPAAEPYRRATHAFEAAVNKFGPDDFFTFSQLVAGLAETATFRQILALLKLSGWDHEILMRFFENLMAQLPSLTEGDWRDLHFAVRKVWERYYAIGEDLDLAFHLGVILLEIREFAEALEFFQFSGNTAGPNAATSYNIGMCHFGLSQFVQALSRMNEVLGLSEDFDSARLMRVKLESMLDTHQQQAAASA